MSALRKMMTPPPFLVLALVLLLVVTLPTPAVARPQESDAVVLEAAPAALPPPVTSSERFTAAGTRLGGPQPLQDGPQLRSSQGPEGFAYESSHPVLDAYGALSTATQYHAQDGLGRYRYSFRHPGAAREEYVDENGRVQGSYSYDMPNGDGDGDEETVSLSYFADDTGFHVKRAVLPNLAALAPTDEPAVAAIKAAHLRLWRTMWARAAAASVGAPLEPQELTEETYEPESLESSLESEIISSDPADDPPTEQDFFAPSSADTADPEPAEDEEIVPTFPGGPDVPSVPVSSLQEPLPSGAGFSSPDAETVIVSARIGEFSASGGGRPQQQFRSRPLERFGALRLRDANFGGAPAELSFFAAAASAPVPTQVRARDANSPPAPFWKSRGSHSAAAPAPESPRAQFWRSRHSPSAPALRVSEEATRAGLVPVAGRHSLAQVRPSQRRLEDETTPVLEEEAVLYYYADLLNAARQAAPPRIVVV